MLIIAMLVATLAIYTVSKIYATDEHRLPPATTPKGKEARIVLGIVLILACVVLILDIVDRSEHGRLTGVWVITLVLAACIPLIRYIQFKKKHKKDK